MDEILNIALLEDENSSDDDVDDALVLQDNENLGNRAALYGHFNLDNLLNIECRQLFRFEKDHIIDLARALGIPERIRTDDRVSVSGVTGLCILLRRLSYPNRLVELEPLFGLCLTALSSIFNLMLNIISENKGYLLENIPFRNQHKLTEYSQAITEKGCPLLNCWGFTDGTARAICRPSVDQENY